MEKAKFVEPNEVAKMASEVQKLFNQGANDDEIGSKLMIENKVVTHLRLLLGIRATRLLDLKTGFRVVGIQNGQFRINTFALTSIVNDLGLDQDKNYKWIVSDVRKGEFTIQVTEKE